jgi:hypothetical protein
MGIFVESLGRICVGAISEHIWPGDGFVGLYIEPGPRLSGFHPRPSRVGFFFGLNGI